MSGTVPRIASLDHLAPGDSFDLGTLSLPREEVLAFATRFDPQPFHLDDAAAAESIFRTLVASGLHTLSAVFGRLITSGLIADVSLGGNQMDVKWPAPLRPDEEVAVRVEVLDLRPSASRASLGIARLRYVATRTADGVIVLDATGTHFLKR
ncbi:MaoC/PaaZ C-terminal domain-containing protein [Humitalea sp. 24SJ18S-53]|uniref:MaoC/PaaZ C-terminal domain-containing protein n=1 Tax=Humitalea sp. 24SJ18S-53 TaxID=3422307 RepID=UPI003D67B95E